MPYEITFTKPLSVEDPDLYFNDCCYGGDVISDLLLPTIRPEYEQVRAEQEDWGWFIWFRRGKVPLAIDIYCDDPDSGVFRIHVSSRIQRFLVIDRIADTPELEELMPKVEGLLSEWIGEPPRVRRVDKNFM
jgi:hypothetical protein